MPEAYVKRLLVTRVVSNITGTIGPIPLEGNAPTDLCISHGIEEVVIDPGTGVGYYTMIDQAQGEWYPHRAVAYIEPWAFFENVGSAEVSFWMAATFLPVNLNQPAPPVE